MANGIKPLNVPANFVKEASLQDRVVFVLAYLRNAGAEEVAAELVSRDGKHKSEYEEERVAKLLKSLYDTGLVNGKEIGEKVIYNLSKITSPNTGKVDPEDLTP